MFSINYLYGHFCPKLTLKGKSAFLISKYKIFYAYFKLFDEFSQSFKIFGVEILHIGEIDGGVPHTVGTDVLVNVIRFRLQYSYTTAVEPVLTLVTADVEPTNITNA